MTQHDGHVAVVNGVISARLTVRTLATQTHAAEQVMFLHKATLNDKLLVPFPWDAMCKYNQKPQFLPSEFEGSHAPGREDTLNEQLWRVGWTRARLTSPAPPELFLVPHWKADVERQRRSKPSRTHRQQRRANVEFWARVGDELRRRAAAAMRLFHGAPGAKLWMRRVRRSSCTVCQSVLMHQLCCSPSLQSHSPSYRLSRGNTTVCPRARVRAASQHNTVTNITPCHRLQFYFGAVWLSVQSLWQTLRVGLSIF